MAVQIAHARGAEVIATASPDHADFVRKLGAREVIDYHTVRFEDRVHDADMVLNTVDADTGARSIRVIRPGGILVSVVGDAPADACAAAKIRCAVTGKVNGEMLKSVSELAEQGRLAVRIEKTLPLKDVAQAWDDGKRGHTGGKMIIEVSR
jgi:NADPH:quinone reductase-like Zn-dependent oxidoreductase